MLAVAITKSRFDGKYHATLEGNEYLGNGFTGEGKTKTDAQASLQTAILRQAEHNRERAYLFANDDEHTVFVVYYSEGWVYDIISASRPHASGCLFSASDLKEAIERAKDHINQCFGGVKVIIR